MNETRNEMEEIPKLPPPRPRRSGHIVRSRQAWPPKSPSTDSTTSLAQLHDKLSALPPLKYNKVPQKISITPELPMVREVSEYDDLNSTQTRTRRFGVARRCQSDCETENPPAIKRSGHQTSSRAKISIHKHSLETHQSDNETTRRVHEYKSVVEDKTVKKICTSQSDTEVNTVVKKFRCISPTNRKQSPNLMLVAALGTSDESVINDTFDKLSKDNPGYDLLDLLVKEAIQNDQEKDSGVCSKITQGSDVVENTPVEKIVQKKKLTINKPKPTVLSNSPTDESNTDAIEDTPCYVFDRKRRVRADNKKTLNTVSEEIGCFDADIVDTFFSQHINENNGNIVVSPTLARKINETSSEASDGDYADADNVICCDEHNNNIFVFDEDIVDCLNSIIDRVCSDFDKYTDLVNKQERQIDNLNTEQIFDEVVYEEKSDEDNRNPNVTSKTKNDLKIDDFDDQKAPNNTKKITLKFNFTKKRNSKMNTKQKNAKNIKEVKKVEEDNKSTDNTNMDSPVNTTEALIRKKRKLYSPKDHDNDNEIPITKTESRQSNINKTPLAACYKELEKAHKNRIRLPRKSRVSSEPLLSPKTRELNDLFDKIRGNVVVNEKIKTATRSSKKKYDMYNLSSESDDQDFKKKKINVQKRVSSSSLESSATKRGRLVKHINYSEIDSCLACSSEDEGIKAKKVKTTKQSKPRSRKVKVERNINLIDERMRQEQQEILQTSFIKETIEVENPKEPEPILQEAPALEIMPDNLSDIATDIVPNTKIRTPTKQEILKIKKEKGTNQRNEKVTKSVVTKKGKGPMKKEEITVLKESDSATVSPLPGLVVETEQTHKDDLTSSLETNLLQKFKKIYTDVHDPIEIEVTQNLLLSTDNNNHENVDIDLSPVKPIELLSDSEKSIATDGRSPITGHNDLDEPPPQVEMLHENFQHRDLETHDMSREMVEFLVNMRNQLHCKVPERTSPVLPMTRNSTKGSIKKQSSTSVKSSNSVPVVVLKRLSSEEIETSVNPIATPSQTSKVSKRGSKAASNRESSEEVAEFRTPTTKKSSSTSPQVFLNRLSSDELNKWLPIPQITYRATIDEKPKKYNTRDKRIKLTGVRKVTPEKNVEKKFKSLISPVKLSFDLTVIGRGINRSNTRSSAKSSSHATKIDRNNDKAITTLRQKSSKTEVTEKEMDNKISTQRKRKEVDTQIDQNKKAIISSQNSTETEARDKEIVNKISTQRTRKEIDTNVDRNKRVNISRSHNSSKTEATEKEMEHKISTQRTRKEIDTNVYRNKRVNISRSHNSSKTDATEKEVVNKISTQRKRKEIDTDMNKNVQSATEEAKKQLFAGGSDKLTTSPENSKSIASVHEWFQRNVASSTGRADNFAMKDILTKVMETLETTVAEIHQSTGEKLTHMFLENQKDFKALEEDIHRRIEEMKKKSMERACELLRKDAEKKSLLIDLLKDDVQAALDLVNKCDK